MNNFIQNEKLNNTFSKRILEKNELLFRQGDLIGDGYIINSGEIMLERNNIKIEKLEEGEVFGIFNLCSVSSIFECSQGFPVQSSQNSPFIKLDVNLIIVF